MHAVPVEISYWQRLFMIAILHVYIYFLVSMQLPIWVSGAWIEVGNIRLWPNLQFYSWRIDRQCSEGHCCGIAQASFTSLCADYIKSQVVCSCHKFGALKNINTFEYGDGCRRNDRGWNDDYFQSPMTWRWRALNSPKRFTTAAAVT